MVTNLKFCDAHIKKKNGERTKLTTKRFYLSFLEINFLLHNIFFPINSPFACTLIEKLENKNKISFHCFFFLSTSKSRLIVSLALILGKDIPMNRKMFQMKPFKILRYFIIHLNNVKGGR